VKLNFSLAFIRLRSQHLTQSDDFRRAVQKLPPQLVCREKLRSTCNKPQMVPNRDGNSKYLWKAALAATENRCGTAGPQAWAEFCLAYCKRLGLLLAMPVTEIGCTARPLRFVESDGHPCDHILRKLFAKVRFAGVISQPLFHRAKVA
jgi:hypothetical protein